MLSSSNAGIVATNLAEDNETDKDPL